MRAVTLLLVALLVTLAVVCHAQSALRGQSAAADDEAYSTGGNPNSPYRIRGMYHDNGSRLYFTVDSMPNSYMCSTPGGGASSSLVCVPVPQERLGTIVKPSEKSTPQYFDLVYVAGTTTVFTFRTSDLATLESTRIVSDSNDVFGRMGLALSADEAYLYTGINMVDSNAHYKLTVAGLGVPSLNTTDFIYPGSYTAESRESMSNGVFGSDPRYLYFVVPNGSENYNYPDQPKQGSVIQFDVSNKRYLTPTKILSLPAGVDYGKNAFFVPHYTQRDIVYIVAETGQVQPVQLGSGDAFKLLPGNYTLAGPLGGETFISAVATSTIAVPSSSDSGQSQRVLRTTLVTRSSQPVFVKPNNRFIRLDITTGTVDFVARDRWWSAYDLTALAVADDTGTAYVGLFMNGQVCTAWDLDNSSVASYTCYPQLVV